jgi:uncharacterized repeat protein (TIGR03803 family)
MTIKKSCMILSTALVLAVVAVILADAARAQTETVLHTFHGHKDGDTPTSGLVPDEAGNLYGTTLFGGDSTMCPGGCGTVFEMTAPSGAGGHWTYSILYRFGQGPNDGIWPDWPLILDPAGNLYGSTFLSATVGFGTVFELSPPAVKGGAWTENILYDFTGPDETIDQSSPLLLDSQGNLYGESQGGANGIGSIFKLSPPAMGGGAWTYEVLFAFPSGGLQGAVPRSGLIWGRNGNLYGVTQRGGDANCNGGFSSCGVAFELVKPAMPGAIWTERVIHEFLGSGGNGRNPNALIFHNGNNLYGTAYDVGTTGPGTIFQLTPPDKEGDPWTETVLFAFNRFDSYGFGPGTSVIFDKAGNLYTTTSVSAGGLGEVFELSPPALKGGAWTPKVLHNFTGGADGGNFPSGLSFDKGNVLFGTTRTGGIGPFSAGVVFRVQP